MLLQGEVGSDRMVTKGSVKQLSADLRFGIIVVMLCIVSFFCIRFGGFQYVDKGVHLKRDVPDPGVLKGLEHKTSFYLVGFRNISRDNACHYAPET